MPRRSRPTSRMLGRTSHGYWTSRGHGQANVVARALRSFSLSRAAMDGSVYPARHVEKDQSTHCRGGDRRVLIGLRAALPRPTINVECPNAEKKWKSKKQKKKDAC